MELNLTTLVQDIFLVARSSDDHQLQHYAAWAVSFLRDYIWSSNLHNEDRGPNSASQSVPDDSIVMKLSLWLMNLHYSEVRNLTMLYFQASHCFIKYLLYGGLVSEHD